MRASAWGRRVPVYRYQAVNAQGRPVAGEISADDAASARQLLVDQSLLPKRVARKLSFESRWGVDSQLLLFVQSLHALLQAGLDIVEALGIACSRVQHGALRRSLDAVHSAIQAGHAPSEAFARDLSLYGPLWIAALKAGEASGDMPRAVGAYGDHLERMLALRRKAVGAVLYPLLLIAMIVVVVVVLLVVVVPRLTEGYESLGSELPVITQALVAFSKAVPWVLTGLLLAAGGVSFWMKQSLTPEQRAGWVDRTLARVPVLGNIRSEARTVSHGATLSLLVSAGNPVHLALQLMAATETNADLKSRLYRAGQAIEKGQGITATFSDFGLFPDSAMQMLEAGERSGNFEKMLERVSAFYKGSLDVSIQRFATLAEPVLMLVIGLVIGLVVLAVYMPIFSMTQGLQ